MISHSLLKHAKTMQHKCETHSFSTKLHAQVPNCKKTKRTICNIFVQTSYHTATRWMAMNWVPVHDRVKYFSLLHTKNVLWAYTASYTGVGGGRLSQVDDGYSHASSVQDKASFPCMFLSARNSTIIDNSSLNQWQCYFLPLLPSLNTDSNVVWHGRILTILNSLW